MKEKIRAALDHIGYNEAEATERELKMAFLDFVNDGVFGNLTVDEALDEIEEGIITPDVMCYNLLKVR